MKVVLRRFNLANHTIGFYLLRAAVHVKTFAKQALSHTHVDTKKWDASFGSRV